MVVQPPQTRVCLSCQCPAATSRTAQLRVAIARLNAALRPRQQIGLATGVLAGAEDRLWPVIRGLTC